MNLLPYYLPITIDKLCGCKRNFEERLRLFFFLSAVAIPNFNSLLYLPFIFHSCSFSACCNISISADHGHTKHARRTLLEHHQQHTILTLDPNTTTPCGRAKSKRLTWTTTRMSCGSWAFTGKQLPSPPRSGSGRRTPSSSNSWTRLTLVSKQTACWKIFPSLPWHTPNWQCSSIRNPILVTIPIQSMNSSNDRTYCTVNKTRYTVDSGEKEKGKTMCELNSPCSFPLLNAYWV